MDSKSDVARMLEQLEYWPEWPTVHVPFDFEPAYWPEWEYDEDNPVDDSLACAVRVVRAILTLMPRLQARELIAHIVAAKPKGLLAIVFDARMENAATLAEILSVDTVTSPEVFRQIMESKAMIDLFWDHPTMLLFVPSFRLPTTVTPENRRARVVDSLLSIRAARFGSSVPQSLTDAVSATCKDIMAKNKCEVVRGPLVLRCLYRASKLDFDTGRFTLSWKDYKYQVLPDAEIKGKGVVKWAESPKTKKSGYIRIAAVHLGGNFVSAQFYTSSGHPLDPIPGEAVRKDGFYMMYFLRNDAEFPDAPCDAGIQPAQLERAEACALFRLSQADEDDAPKAENRARPETASSRASSEAPIHPSRQLIFQGPKGGSIAEKDERRRYSPPPREAPRGPRFRRREDKRQHRRGQDTYVPNYTDMPRRPRSRSRVDSRRQQARAKEDKPESPRHQRPRSRSESPRRRRDRSRSENPRRRRDRSGSESPSRRRDRSRGEPRQKERHRLRSRTRSRGLERDFSERDERRRQGRSKAKEPRLHRESSDRLSLGSPRDLSARRQPSRRPRSPASREHSDDSASRRRSRKKTVPLSPKNPYDGPESPVGRGGVSG
jgi:hypothetical protein